MNIVLGAGISGLLAAQLLRKAHRDFKIIDKDGLGQSPTAKGFFFVPEPSEFTRPEKTRISVMACYGGSEESYRKKVYGDSKPLGGVSFNRHIDNGPSEGYTWDLEKLTEGLEAHFVIGTVDGISVEQKIVNVGGNELCWENDNLISTIPLSVLKQKAFGHPRVIGHSKPIHLAIEETNLSVTSESNILYTRYCASDCHEWYRRSTRLCGMKKTITYEYVDAPKMPPPLAMVVPLKPGKTWFETEDEKLEMDSEREMLRSHYGIRVYGRYGANRPKELTQDVYKRMLEANWARGI